MIDHTLVQDFVLLPLQRFARLDEVLKLQELMGNRTHVKVNSIKNDALIVYLDPNDVKIKQVFEVVNFSAERILELIPNAKIYDLTSDIYNAENK